VTFRDAEKVAGVLRDMSTAGAVLDPDDPVINDVRDLLGVSNAPEMTPERYAMLNPPPVVVDPVGAGAGRPGAAGADDGEQPGPGKTPGAEAEGEARGDR